MMVGRDGHAARRAAARSQPGKPVLEVEGLTLVEDGRTLLDDVSFAVREREILGIAGVDGNGQRELVETLIGLRRPTHGDDPHRRRAARARKPASVRPAAGRRGPRGPPPRRRRRSTCRC